MLNFYLLILETTEERDKFALLYQSYYKLLINIAFGILHNGEDAEDAVQQAFLKLLPNLRKINDVSSHQTINYLVIIVKRVCFDGYHQQKKTVSIAYDELSDDASVEAEDEAFGQMQFDELLQRIKSLPDHSGDVLYLRYCEDFSVKEIAGTLGITSSAAKKRLERAKRQLKALLLAEEERTV